MDILMKYIIASLSIFFSAISISWSLPAPKYLSVPHWKDCVQTMTKGTAQFVCLPSSAPKLCPAASWKILTSEHLIKDCQ